MRCCSFYNCIHTKDHTQLLLTYSLASLFSAAIKTADKMPLSAYNNYVYIVESHSLAMNRLLFLGGRLVYKESSI